MFSLNGFLSNKKRENTILFLITATLFSMWLIPQGTMIDVSGDAASIWKTITSYYSGSIEPSYVLYKGPMSVYPYVWLYQLSILFHANEFLFIMLYHSTLFSYITMIGIPDLIEHFFHKKVEIWQKALLAVVLFWMWESTFALDQLMVDLPSCAIFLMAINSAICVGSVAERKKWILTGVVGFLCGLGATISGQYSLAMLIVLCYTVTRICSVSDLKDKAKRLAILICIVAMIMSCCVPFVGRAVFETKVIEPIRESGAVIYDNSYWLHRGLLFAMDKYRIFYGPQLNSIRGFEMLADYYNSREEAAEKLRMAAAGLDGWTVFDYFQAFFSYPIEFIVNILDKAFICLSIDLRRNNILGLTAGYVMLYISLYELIKRRRSFQQIFCGDALLVAASFATIVPSLVLTVELRHAMSLHAVIYGVAVLGPTLPNIFKSIKNKIIPGAEEQDNRPLKDISPWPFLLCCLFTLCCISHMGSIYAQSGLGAATLFKW